MRFLLPILTLGLLVPVCPIANAGIAAVEASRTSQYIVAASPRRLSELINEFESRYGRARVQIRCDGTGWAAVFYTGYPTRTQGYACGFDSRQAAEAAAKSECTRKGGDECRRVWSAYDDASWTMPNLDFDGVYYKLKYTQD